MIFPKTGSTFGVMRQGGLVGRIQPFYELWRKLARGLGPA